jgi:hypothetical protein
MLLIIIYTDDVNLVGNNINTIGIYTEALNWHYEGGWIVNTEETKHLLLSHHQNADTSYISTPLAIKKTSPNPWIVLNTKWFIYKLSFLF